MNQSNQREMIVYALIDILNEGKYNNIVLQQLLNKNNGFNTVQKAFITECVNGTLRNLLHLDYIINYYSKTNTKKMKPLILNILRSAVYQMIYMDKVPSSAICNEAVKLTKEKGFQGLSGFVNGVLRSIIRNQPEITYPPKDTLSYLSIVYSVEMWLLEYWAQTYSFEEIAQLCEAQNQSPMVSIAVNTTKIDKKSLVKILQEEQMDVQEDCLVPDCLRIRKSADITKKESFQKGYYHVMDQSSMLAVLGMHPKENDVVMDLCGAPGGKSFFASYQMHNKGQIFCYDIHPHKIKLIEDTIQRLGLTDIECGLQDATVFDPTKEHQADCVLVDAPCSGFGMLQKKPDIKYTKTMADVEQLVTLQRSILSNACRYVKVGGTLLYSTCTISPKENLENINWFLAHFPYELADLSPYISGIMKEETITDGYLQLLPQEYHTDGFFIARLVRKGL